MDGRERRDAARARPTALTACVVTPASVRTGTDDRDVTILAHRVQPSHWRLPLATDRKWRILCSGWTVRWLAAGGTSVTKADSSERTNVPVSCSGKAVSSASRRRH